MLCLSKNLKILLRRHHGMYVSRKLISSQEIRRQFLEYFTKQHHHQFVRSSPVVPFCDPSVVFVNAGMNQFKNIFLGNAGIRYPRVVNSQKCVRVGGKHNDLSIVGTDGYHHTFFEMLGNWSFGNYFKKEACEYAWQLLRGAYNIDPGRLYITYFGGDERLQLDSDLECKDIWRSLGVPEARLIPFGIRDNFWEMGSTGPCGPCTEIHIDHLPMNGATENRSQYVNAGLPDLTELWNIVFIEYNRQPNGSLIPLPMKHIDTGMGMERLVAILQNAKSNYGTDLFQPIFDHIHKTTKAPPYVDTYNTKDATYQLSTSYRILADHSRMIAACLADGMFPDQNYKLRRVIRKCISLSERSFMHGNLLHETIPVIVEILGDTYPEMQINLQQINQIISHEHDLFKSLVNSTSADLKEILLSNPRIEETDVIDFPGFIPAYKELQATITSGQTQMTGALMFKLYDTYGLNEETIERLGEIENLTLDRVGFAEYLTATRTKTKNLFSNTATASLKATEQFSTENELKYKYKFNYAAHEYEIPRTKARILAIFLEENNVANIILDQSTFYPESGGQECDHGEMLKVEGDERVVSLDVKKVSQSAGLLVHTGTVSAQGQLKVGDTIELLIDAKRRTGNIQNHTATHLLNAAVKHVMKSATYQRSSSVTSTHLKLEVGVLGKKIDKELIHGIQELVRHVIRSGKTIMVDVIDSHIFYGSDNITRIPGEVYPDANVRILTVKDENLNFLSREPCCGTHASNTGELEDFCITNVKHTGRGAYLFTGVSGTYASQAHLNGQEMLRSIQQIKMDFSTKAQRSDEFEEMVHRIKNMFVKGTHPIIPHDIKLECLDIITEVSKELKDESKVSLGEFVDMEMRSVLEQCPADTHPFIIHVLGSAGLMETVPLQKATRLCMDRPVIVICETDGIIRARCCVPRSVVTERFGAEQWLSEFCSIFDGKIATTQRGQSPKEIAVMKSKRVHRATYDDQLELALQKARAYAEKYFAV